MTSEIHSLSFCNLLWTDLTVLKGLELPTKIPAESVMLTDSESYSGSESQRKCVIAEVSHVAPVATVSHRAAAKHK